MKINKLEKKSWLDVSEHVRKVNKKLAIVIDELNIDPSFTFYKGTYSFGEEFIKKGHLQVSLADNHSIALSNPVVDKKIQEDLGYNFGTSPVSLVLSGAVEAFLVLDGHTITLPAGIIHPGKVFGTWKVLNQDVTHMPAFIWSATSGARSLFMLPKISKASSHRKLMKAFNLQQDTPKEILHHWHVFKEIANHQDFNQHWHSEILFFSKKWFDHINDPAFSKLKLYFLEDAWQHTKYWRHQYLWDLTFSLIQKEIKNKSPAYICNIVKHLITMAVGALPGYIAAQDDSAGPMKNLQEIYRSVYQLEYEPIIMHPQFFSLTQEQSVYFSFEYPNTVEFSNKPREDSSKLNDLLLSKSLLNKYLSNIKDDHLNLKGTPIHNVHDQVNFDFYHTNSEKYSALKNTRDIFIDDVYFNSQIKSIEKFPTTSSFLRGCVRISKR